MKRNRYLLRKRWGTHNRYPDPCGRWRIRKSKDTGYWMAWDADGVVRYRGFNWPFSADAARRKYWTDGPGAEPITWPDADVRLDNLRPDAVV